MTRFDFGTWLLLMHYVACWIEERGPACLVIFVPNSDTAISLAKCICPRATVIACNNLFSRLIFAIFKRGLIQFCTLNRIYAEAYCQWPHALFIFDMTYSQKKQECISCYIPAFDPVLKGPWPFSEKFLNAYLQIQRQNDNRSHVYNDMFQLFYLNSTKTRNKKTHSTEEKNLLEILKIDKPYVIMNLNCKNYRTKAINRRQISYPERYNALIDFFISQGYAVIMQGRNEQPTLAPRKGYIEYFKSPYTSPENDYRLFTHCCFAVLPKTGPEVFASICNVPLLGLDYVELATINPKPRCRFFPKHIWDIKKQAFIHWRELLTRPCFFDVGKLSFEEEIEYVDLEEDELISAAVEFMQLLPRSVTEWSKYTSLQREFKQSLHPAHIDLFHVTEVPCESYLSSKKY